MSLRNKSLLEHLILFAARHLGLFRDRVRDPYCVSIHAELYLWKTFGESASFQASGYLLPEQQQAIDLIVEARKGIALWPALVWEGRQQLGGAR